jgi:ketosteroid isomerase-like protein
MVPNDNLSLIRAYLACLETSGSLEELSAFFDPDVVHRQWPNLIYPDGAVMDLATMRDKFERGKKLLASQRYEITNALAQADEVALEVSWTGTLSVPLKHLSAGEKLTAHCAMFFRVQNGRIVEQRNYDCYERF